jgi:uncharacterized transporter YbjL
MAPEEQIDWSKYLFVAGILIYFVISIGHTISVMKKLDYESQTGMLAGAKRNAPERPYDSLGSPLGLNADRTIFLRAGYFRTQILLVVYCIGIQLHFGLQTSQA